MTDGALIDGTECKACGQSRRHWSDIAKSLQRKLSKTAAELDVLRKQKPIAQCHFCGHTFIVTDKPCPQCALRSRK